MTAVTEVLTFDQWQEFFVLLEGPDGCNFKEERPGDPSSITWNCKGGMDKTYSKAILAKMGVPDAAAWVILSYCESLGGHCDCEVLFNAEERIQEDLKREETPS